MVGYKYRLIYISLLFIRVRNRSSWRDVTSHAICRRLPVVIVIDFGKSTESTMKMRGKEKKARDEKGIWSPRFLPIFQDRGTKRARSQRQVSGDPEIRNGCKRAPRLKEEECPFLRVASSGRDPERTRFPRSTLAKVDHRGKNSLNTPLMSRLRSLVVCGYAISPSLTLLLVH